MPAPTLADYQQSGWSGTSSASEVTPTVTWLAADDIYVLGATEDQAVSLGVPTATGLTFSQISVTGTANNTKAYLWKATAAGSGSSAITATASAGGTASRGISAFVIRGSDGNGTPVLLQGGNTKTISVTRAQANSRVLEVLADWAAINDVVVDATPTGTVRVAQFNTGDATFFVLDFDDQGATGTTAYGITNHTGTVDMSGIAVEIKGTAAAAATLPPRPRQTLSRFQGPSSATYV